MLGATAVAGLEALAVPPAEGDSVLLPAPEILFGAWVPGGQGAVKALQRQLDRKLDIVHWYQGWSPPASSNLLDSPRARSVASAGSVPMITWEPWLDHPLHEIVQGDHDGYIRQNARALRSVPGIVWLRFGHEMNLPIYPWSATEETGKDYIAAWRRIVRIFRQQGALNVRFVWAPNVLTPSSTPLRHIWPGKEYVDYVGMDGYNWGDTVSPPSWKRLPQIFGPLYKELRALTTLPIVITEVACADTGGDKSAWIRQAFAHDLSDHLPAVIGVVWFNEDKEADWRIDSDDTTLRAARVAFDHPPYGAMAPV